MATKAERFKARSERAARAPQPKRRRLRRDIPVDTAQPGVSATDRKAGGGSTGTRNATTRVAKRGGPDLEDSATGKPSRKSTRGSSGRIKQATNLQRRAVRATHSPETRARRPSKGATRSKATGGVARS
jgi:hypothetical protein